jgi:long-chain fatty acid transport protein
VNPTVAYRLGPLRLGAGLDIVRGTVELSRDVRFGTEDGSLGLGAGAWGVGANGGVQLDLLERLLTLGVQYRSAVRLGFDGNAHFADVPAAFASTIHDQRATTALVQPDSLALGVAMRPLQPLVVDLDVVWFGWAKLSNVNIDFPDDATGTLATSTAKSWSNTANVHLGGELALDREWRIRAGALIDPSPSPRDTLTAELPDATRLNLALGAGYTHRSGVYVDLGYQFILLFTRHSTAPALPGEYGGFVDLLGLTVGYSTPLDSYR